MFKRSKKNCGLNKKAFSLVEVLCAIVLLALVATPILQALYSGLTINIKSRKLLAASDLTSGTMEFISSMVYKDYEYEPDTTDAIAGDPAKLKVKGLESYYWGGATGYGNVSNCLLNTSSPILYPDGPSCDYSGYDNSGNTKHRILYIENAEMDGFKFDVKIEMKDPAPSDAKYYCYDAKVTVYEHGKTSILSEASTKVPNKY